MTECSESLVGELDLLAWHQAVYRAAIDARAGNGEGATWWLAVAKEVDAVVSAPSATAGAKFITWWHHDWATVNDTPLQASRRLRRQAKVTSRPHG